MSVYRTIGPLVFISGAKARGLPEYKNKNKQRGHCDSQAEV